MARTLINLIGPEARVVQQTSAMVSSDVKDDIEKWELGLERKIQEDERILETDRLALVLARRGQGVFKRRVARTETRCRVTGVEKETHLVASHCKPWRDATNDERLDGENGLLLTPTIDHPFDRGFIGFENNGRLIVSPVAHRPSLQRMGVEVDEPLNVGAFSEGQRRFLDFHRERILLQSIRR